jgi:putative sterol carrier protein
MNGEELTRSSGDGVSPEIVIPDLAGRVGRLGVEVDGRLVAVIAVDHGHVSLAAPAEGRVDAVIVCRSEEDYRRIVSGAVDSTVAALRGRLAMRGDLVLATKVVRGLRAAALDAEAAENG